MFKLIKKYIAEYRELRYFAYHDSLTGLLNRNWLYKKADSIKKKYVYFLDLNDLRNINKQGHTVGDLHIKNIVKSIKIGANDIFIRYAGDEFIIFSDTENLLITNIDYSVGFAEIKFTIPNSINEADKQMIESKRKFKNLLIF